MNDNKKHDSAAAPAVAPSKWIDDPHDIEQGRMLNPEWLRMHGLTASQASLLADPSAAPTTEQSSEVAQAGLPISQEPKYTVTRTHIVNRASGEAVPHDEPVFVFRARDALGVRALEAYLVLIGEREPSSMHADAVRGRIADFQRFASAHPDRMKWPDTATAPQAGAESYPPSKLAKELVRLADIMRDCGRLVSTSGHAEMVFREASAALRARGAVPSGAECVPSDQFQPCPSCFGTGVEGDADDYGRTIDVTCGSCNGSGRAPAEAAPPTLEGRYRETCTHGKPSRCLGGCLSTEPCYLAAHDLRRHPPAALPGEQDARDAAFEAVRQRLCKLPKSSFIRATGPYGGVQRVDDQAGRWIEFDAAHELFDPVAVDAAMAAAKGRTDGGCDA